MKIRFSPRHISWQKRTSRGACFSSYSCIGNCRWEDRGRTFSINFKQWWKITIDTAASRDLWDAIHEIGNPSNTTMYSETAVPFDLSETLSAKHTWRYSFIICPNYYQYLQRNVFRIVCERIILRMSEYSGLQPFTANLVHGKLRWNLWSLHFTRFLRENRQYGSFCCKLQPVRAESRHFCTQHQFCKVQMHHFQKCTQEWFDCKTTEI